VLYLKAIKDVPLLSSVLLFSKCCFKTLKKYLFYPLTQSLQCSSMEIIVGEIFFSLGQNAFLKIGGLKGLFKFSMRICKI
jgi:hypothetical protein